MIKIRKNVFETISSSTHSIVLCTYEQYHKFERGELFYVDTGALDANERWCTFEEVLELFKSRRIYSWSTSDIAEKLLTIKSHEDDEELEDALAEYSIYSNNTYFHNDCLEDFYEELELPDGQTVVAFGVYGYDG